MLLMVVTPARYCDVGVEIHDVELLELLGADGLDADRHVLQILRHLLRGDHDLFERAAAGIERPAACSTMGAPPARIAEMAEASGSWRNEQRWVGRPPAFRY